MIILPGRVREKECKLCGERSKIISESIGVCVRCLRERPEEALAYAEETHRRSREKFGLPPSPPRSRGGIRCGLCDADCVIGEGEKGYCGLRENVGGALKSLVDEKKALLHYYLDAHVTNCLPEGVTIMLHDGTWMKIKDVVEKIDGDAGTLSYYRWRFRKEEISRRHKFRFEGKLVRIKTETGLEIEVTEDHRILADGKIPVYLPASDLKPGDRIFTLLRKRYNDMNKTVKLAQYLPEDISVYDQDIKSVIKRFLSRKGSRSNVKRYKRIRRALTDRRRGIKFALLRELCKELSIDWGVILDKISIVGYKKKLVLKERELKPEHMYLLGLLYSDGHVKKKRNLIVFTNTSEELLKHVQVLYEKLFENSKLRRYARKVGLKMGRKKSIYTRKQVMVLEASNPVMKKLYEGLILNHLGLPFNLGWLGKDLVASFLAGMLDGDGHVSLKNNRTEIGFVLKNKNHANMLLLLLRNLGVAGRLQIMSGESVYRVVVRSSKSCERLCSLLLPYSIIKREKLDALLKIARTMRRRVGLDERLPLFFSTLLHEIRMRHSIPKSKIHNPITLKRYETFSRNPCMIQAREIVKKLSENVKRDLLLDGLKILIDCELIPERIEEIEYVDYEGYVYDITLTEAHNFLANGILVKNCCAAWFCPAGTGSGYPTYAVRHGPEYGYYNLALFFYGCSFDCLFCQNWSHKKLRDGRLTSVDELIQYTLRDDRITCWCWFGGSPEPQLPFALNASKTVLEEKRENRILRICFEWNGCGAKGLVRKAGELAYVSGGNIKFDLKAYTPSVHKALTGRDNKRALENFELIYREFYERRRDVPVLNATTLLVPHYVDEFEVAKIAEFIASLDPEIPYSLLIFHPDYLMSDVTVTPRKQVERCYQAAKRYLKNVNIGNIALLGLAEAET